MANTRKSRLLERATLDQNITDNMVRCAIYARVSSDGQAKEQTIDRQLSIANERFQSLFGNNPLARLEGNYQDNGYNLEIRDNSRAFWKLIEKVKSKEINTIICANSDRLFRGESAQLRGEVTDVFRHLNVRLISQNEDHVYRVTDTAGRITSAVLQELGAIAKLTTVSVLQTGRIRKLCELGQWRLTNVPFGFRCKKTGDRSAPFLYSINREESAAVRDIFRLYVGDSPEILTHSLDKPSLSVYDIADILNRHDVSRSAWVDVVPAAVDKPWNKNHVLQILQNETYVGRLVVSFRAQPKHNIPSTTKVIRVPAIVDEEIFDRARLKYQTYHDKLIRNKRPRGFERWLHRMMICPECHSPLIARRHSRAHPLYGCAASESHRCYRAKDLEMAVARELTGLQANDDLLSRIVNLANGSEGRAADELAAIKAQEEAETSIKERQSVIDKLTEKWGRGQIDDQNYQRVAKKISAEISRFEEDRTKQRAILSTVRHQTAPTTTDRLTMENVRQALTWALNAAAGGAYGRQMRVLLESLATHVEIKPALPVDIKALADDEILSLLKEGRVLRREVADVLGIGLTTIKRRWPGSFGMRTSGRGIDYRVVIRFKGDAGPTGEQA